MNIIKFKDIRLDENTLPKCNCSCKLSGDQIKLFNKRFKGKYAYAINWEFAVPLEYMTQEEYIKVSMGALDLPVYCLNIKYLTSLIDIEETNTINNVDKFEALNKYTTDSDVTLDEIKRFRPWLAHTLLENGKFDCDTTHMLEYYSYDDDSTLEGSGMYDGVIKQLSSFGNTKMIFNTPTYISSCGCHGDTKGNLNSFNNISSLNTHKCECSSNGLSMLNNCGKSFDIVSIYKMNLYVKMVDTFRNVDFWLPFKKIVIDMKNYVDNIIKTNLPLTTAQPVSNYVDCGCLSVKNSEQQINMEILRNLSQALEYIINDDVKTHKNIINDALLKWASVLYEKMYWYNQVNIQQNHTCGKSSVFMYVQDGDVYIKGIGSDGNRQDYKILNGKDGVAEPLTDKDIVTGKFFKDYIDKVIYTENEKDEDRHEFQPIGDDEYEDEYESQPTRRNTNTNIINIIENLN